jgi:hypothetical protein
MDSEFKLIAARGCQIVVGNTATPVLTGYEAFGATVRIDATQIKSIKQNGTDVTTKTYENVALIVSEYISFETPITSITLNGATDSVMLWLKKARS